jgi:TRAP-type C4-dicarboxylate transport system substrate-binding protein
MKQKLVTMLLTVVFLLTFTSVAMSATVLRYADHDPPSGLRVNSVKLWFKLIEEETDGRVKVKPFFGGAMGKASEALKLVADGSVDMAFVFPDFYPKQLKANNIFKLFPQGPGSWENISWIYNKVYETIPLFSEELAKQNQKALYITSAVPAAMCATYPVNSIDDLKGKKWRASSRWHLAYLKAMGATPVSVPWGDCYMALQTGIIDGVLTDYDGLHDTKLDEAAPNIFVSPKTWFGSPFLHTINLDTWNSLSKQDQDGILRAAKKISETVFGPMHVEEYGKIIEAEKKAGVKIVFWKESDLDKWNNNNSVTTVRQIWSDEAKQAGVTDADEVMENVRKIVEEAVDREK